MWTQRVLRFKSGRVGNRGSALFIPTHKATECCVIVNPHIDTNRWVNDIESLRNNLTDRKSDYDINKLKTVWDFTQELKVNQIQLEDVLKDLRLKLKTDSENVKLNNHLKIVKEDLRQLKGCLWSIEESAMKHALSLPNVLHPKTPKNTPKIIFDSTKYTKSRADHLEIAHRLDIVKYASPENYYLKKDAVLFELGAKFYISEKLRESGFVQFSNPDFSRSVIVEGCGLDPANPETVFTIQKTDDDEETSAYNLLHLTGGASLTPFAAYYTKNILYPSNFPLRHYATGRQYNPNSRNPGLFGVNQATAVQIFTASLNTYEALNLEIHKIYQIAKDIYGAIDIPFRMSYKPAQELAHWESLRVSIEMYSTSLKKHIEVAHISVSDDYVAKRLLFVYQELGKKIRFPKIVSGTLLNVPSLLACALENGDEEFRLPAVFKPTNWM